MNNTNTPRVTISRTNAKMGGIPSFSLPPVVTCANCEGCAKKCYARRMAARYPNVRESWARNLEAWKTSPEAVRLNIMAAALTSSYFRYFVGGDIPDPAFFALMCEIARAVPTCHFLAFTKKYEMVNSAISEGETVPANLHIIFSEWKNNPPNPHALPTSRVIFRGEETPEGAKVCGGNCTACVCRGIGCWSLKSGETIHFYEH